MPYVDVDRRQHGLRERYVDVRAATERLAVPLSPEDQTVQSMPDVSPTKWHRAHTSWFFETFLLEPELAGYRSYHPAYAYLFNSYYEAVGTRHPRPRRGIVSRPGVEEIAAYRHHVDGAMERLLREAAGTRTLDLVELGLHHEQQHQELLLMDIKHVLSCNPMAPAYEPGPEPARPSAAGGPPGWVAHPGGVVEIGHGGDGFAFDNEGPRHRALLTPFALADRPVTCGEWLAFMADGGYHRPELWLSDGWALAQAERWEAPSYWSRAGERPAWSAGDGPRAGAANGSGRGGHDGWRVFTLRGERGVDPDEPVCHVSYYEADAYAHWTGLRLPTETEWEAVVADYGPGPSTERPATLHPSRHGPRGAAGHPPGAGVGEVWEWTASAYAPYPGYRAPAGAVGEYNGKFMVNQYVLRGGCCATPAGHVRPTYRNFFPAAARWAFSGLRLARDL